MFLLKKKRIEYLRSIWGKQIDKHRNYDLISSYYDLLAKNRDEEFVDDKTWNDLDFDSVFAKMDRNISGIGQQYLYYLLHKYENNESILKNRYKLVSYLKKDRKLRESIQLNLFNLSGVASYFTAYLVLSKNLPNTKYYPLFYLCSFLSIISLLLISINGIFLFVSLAILLTDLILNKIFSKKIYEYFTGFSSLNSLIISAISISKIKTNTVIDEIDFLKQKRDLLKSLKKKLGYLVIDKSSMNELALTVIEYLNMFLLFDIIAYYRSVNILIKNQADIRATFENVASLDTSISVASYLEEIPFYSTPTFSDADTISFRDLYHPLIQNAVSNTVENIKDSVLITGSNMSGKTTFIKTVGINIILSQSIYFCLTNEIITPKLVVKSSIRRNEELEEGKSYFFVEIESLNNFIKLSEERNNYLFLIDEIFRGTNTIERLASSTAVLKYLNTNNKVFVTTHDIELQDLLEHNFKMFHFSEQVENSKFFFNYKIKEGPCSSGNAIKLLGIMKYPESIITEANNIVQGLLSNGPQISKVKT
jgi:DNA mismatch repair ATPase MutS